MLYIKCHMSCVTCQELHIISNLSGVTCNLQNTFLHGQTVRARELRFLQKVYPPNLSRVMCHVSQVWCHKWCVMSSVNMWLLTLDSWHMKHDTWHVSVWGRWTFCQNCRYLALTVCPWRCFEDDTWHVGCEVWHVTCDLWHLTPDRLRKMGFLSKFQLPSFNGLAVKVFWR